MINLVWKDIIILKKTLWIAPAYGFLVVFVFNHMNGGALSAATVGVTYLLMIQACARDDKNKSEVMLNSLPLRRRDIVFAKYLSTFPYAALGILSFLLAQNVVSLTGIPLTIDRLSLEGIAGALIAIMGMISFYYPVYFKLGFIRSNMVGMILFFGYFFGVGLIGSGLQKIHNPRTHNLIQGFAKWFQTQADWQIAFYLIAFAFALLAASILLSLKFYSSREF